MLHRIKISTALFLLGRRHLKAMIGTLFFLISTYMCRCFKKPSSAILKQRQLLLNIACGSLVHEGWINLDMQPKKGAFYMDARQKLPFKDTSVLHIHCEHFLEHLDRPAAIAFLKELYRILEPQGSARIILPDAERYLVAYCEKENSFFSVLKNLGGATEPFRTPIEVINQMFRMGGGAQICLGL